VGLGGKVAEWVLGKVDFGVFGGGGNWCI